MIIVHVTYKMKPGTKEAYVKEVQEAGIDRDARKDPGNLAYENYYSAFREDEVILFEMWEDQASSDHPPQHRPPGHQGQVRGGSGDPPVQRRRGRLGQINRIKGPVRGLVLFFLRHLC